MEYTIPEKGALVRKLDDNRKTIILDYINEYYDRYGRILAVHGISTGTGIPNTSVHRYLVAMKESGELDYIRFIMNTGKNYTTYLFSARKQ